MLASRSVSTRYPRLLVSPGCGGPASPDRQRHHRACQSGASRGYGGLVPTRRQRSPAWRTYAQSRPKTPYARTTDPCETGEMRPQNSLRLSVHRRLEIESPSPQGSTCWGSTTRPVSCTVLTTLPSSGLYRPITLANQEEMPGDGSINCLHIGAYRAFAANHFGAPESPHGDQVRP